MRSAFRDRTRILHFVECWLPQTETWLYNHTNALPESTESHFVCQWTENLDQFPPKNLASVSRPPREPNLFMRAVRRAGLWNDAERHLPLLEAEIQRIKPDILHSHFGHYGWINSKLAMKFRLRHVVSFYGFDANYLPASDPRWVSRYRQMSERVDAVLCEGPHMARCIADHGVSPGKINIFRLGADLNQIPFLPRKNPAKNTIRFLIAGTFREKKGIPYAIEALGRVNKYHPNIEITVIGNAGSSQREQREKAAILMQVECCGLREKTHFLGYKPYEFLKQQFYSHDIFLSPSVTALDGDTEGGAPVNIIEAAASGMPVISTRHCDIPFVLSGANQPFLVAERDPDALAHVIQMLLDLEDWEPIVRANRGFIEAQLDVNKQGQNLARIYESVLNGAPAERLEGAVVAAAHGWSR